MAVGSNSAGPLASISWATGALPGMDGLRGRHGVAVLGYLKAIGSGGAPRDDVGDEVDVQAVRGDGPTGERLLPAKHHRPHVNGALQLLHQLQLLQLDVGADLGGPVRLEELLLGR